MSNMVELNKNGRPIGWHGQCWVYYKQMMEIAFENKNVLEYASGTKTLASNATDEEKSEFKEGQVKVKQIIMSSLSMELGQQVMMKKTGTEMWKYLMDTYEGTANAATRTNQEIILYNKLQAAKCKPNWDVRLHVNNMFLIKEQLAAINADVRDPIFINLLIRSLPANPRFDRLRGMVEIGTSDVDTPEKLKDQILRMDSYNKCDKELGVTGGNGAHNQGQGQGQRAGHNQKQSSGIRTKTELSEKAAAIATKKLDQQQSNCFRCHQPGHQQKDCPKKSLTSTNAPKAKQATYTKRLEKSENPKQSVAPVVPEQTSQVSAPDTSAVPVPVTTATPDIATPTDHGRHGNSPRGSDQRDHCAEEYANWEWCLDNAANVHVASDQRYFTEYKPFSDQEADRVRGFQKKFAAVPLGHGTVKIEVKNSGPVVILTLRDVFFVPDSKNLLSHSQAEDQGYDIEYHGRKGKKVYELWERDKRLLEVGRDPFGLYTFSARNSFLPKNTRENPKVEEQTSSHQPPPRVTITAADGAADLQRWHERLGHLCPQFVKTMVDHDLVTGMLLRQRSFADCEACHLGKQRKPSPKQTLEREIRRKNQVVFADLLFPHQSSSAKLPKAVLVIVDGYSRYTTVYPLKSKTASEVNTAMRRYIAWAERQFSKCKVLKVITDSGKEFVNEEMNQWYQQQGIAFLPNPPHGSHLNLTERANQTLTHMMKTMLTMAGLPKPQFWMYALKMATFIRNRSYCQAIKDTPYRLMMDKKPDLHRLKRFGAVAYVHRAKDPSRRKLDNNCRIGFVVSYLEGQPGYEVYFPTEKVVQHVLHASVNEEILYKDRYQEGYPNNVKNWLSSVDEEQRRGDAPGSTYRSAIDEQDVAAEKDNNSPPDSSDLPDDEEIEELSPAAHTHYDTIESPESDLSGTKEWMSMPMYTDFPKSRADQEVSRASEDETMSQPDVSSQIPEKSQDLTEVTAQDAGQQAEDHVNGDNTPEEKTEESEDLSGSGEPMINDPANSDDEAMEVEPSPSSELESQMCEEPHDTDELFEHDGDPGQVSSEECENHKGEDSSPAESDWTLQSPWDRLDIVDAYDCEHLERYEAQYATDPTEEDAGDVFALRRESTGLQEEVDNQIIAVDAGNGMDTVMEPEVLTGYLRSSLEAELDDVQEHKRLKDAGGQPQRMILRSESERHVPYRLGDYHLYASFCRRESVKESDFGPEEDRWHIKDVKIPRSFPEAMRSPQSREWLEGMEREVNAMFKKDVFELIDESEMPDEAHLLSTMWRFQAKTDDEGYVTRWRPRLVGRGDFQQFGVDFEWTFSPVARMVTFRVVVAIAAKLGLDLYQGDIDTAYLNAVLKIKQYVRGIPGFPCPKGQVYRVNHALYGLHQSGAEWFEEIDRWLKSMGFVSTQTEPCLYIYCTDGVFAMIPLYVDDVVLATNSVEFKKSLFAAFDEKYGFKDGGKLHSFLGVQVEQSDNCIRIHQEKYCNEILERFGFDGAHGSATPMETTAKYSQSTRAQDEEPSFDYRGAIGALMYLATSTRPDIAYSVGYLSRFVANPTQKHCGAVKRILRYLVSTKNLGIVYSLGDTGVDSIVISAHSDSDWGNDPDSRKSITGFVMTIAGGAVAWAARRQTIVAQSTAEAEYVAACEAAMEGRGIVNMLDEVLPVINVSTSLELGMDNNAAIALATAPTYNSRTRHIELRWHYVRDQVMKGLMEIHKIAGLENPADMFTKPLPKRSLAKYREKIGMAAELQSTHD